MPGSGDRHGIDVHRALPSRRWPTTVRSTRP